MHTLWLGRALSSTMTRCDLQDIACCSGWAMIAVVAGGNLCPKARRIRFAPGFAAFVKARWNSRQVSGRSWVQHLPYLCCGIRAAVPHGACVPKIDQPFLFRQRPGWYGSARKSAPDGGRACACGEGHMKWRMPRPAAAGLAEGNLRCGFGAAPQPGRQGRCKYFVFLFFRKWTSGAAASTNRKWQTPLACCGDVDRRLRRSRCRAVGRTA